MKSRDLSSWMWGDALSMLEKAERLHRQFCKTGAAGLQCWEPPVDIIETADAVVVYVALPGVPANAIEVVFDPDGITVSGERRFPARRPVRLHRIEIPSGRFQRRILLPLHALEPAMPQLADGCLAITLTKVKESR